MEKTKRKLYEAPSVEEVEVAMEGVICASGERVIRFEIDPEFNDPFNAEEEW